MHPWQLKSSLGRSRMLLHSRCSRSRVRSKAKMSLGTPSSEQCAKSSSDTFDRIGRIDRIDRIDVTKYCY